MRESWFLILNDPSSLIIWYFLCRVFMCTLLIVRNKYIYISRWMGIFRWVSSCNPPQCVEDPPQISFFLWNCVCTFSENTHFYHLHCIDQHFPNHFFSLIENAESFTLFCLRFQELFLHCLFGDLLPWESLLLYEWKCFAEAVNHFKI